jgi:hypothetical protein
LLSLSSFRILVGHATILAGPEGFGPSERALTRSPDYKSGAIDLYATTPELEGQRYALAFVVSWL